MKIVPTILALTIFTPAQSQNFCDETSLISAVNSNIRPLPFNPKAVYINTATGKFFGCDPVGRGKFCELIITQANYDVNNCRISLEGYYFLNGLFRKQQPFDFIIFLGEPRRNESGPFLSNIRRVAQIVSRQYENGNTVSRYSDGYFRIEFSFTASDRLYFDAGPHVFLTEYNVGCLLQANEYRQLQSVR